MKGVAGAEGIAIGTVKIISNLDIDAVTSSEIESVQGGNEERDSAQEIERYKHGLKITISYFNQIIEKLSGEFEGDEAEIYEGYIEILEDEDINDDIIRELELGTHTAEFAVNRIYSLTEDEFASMDNEYFASRAEDIGGIKQKLMTAILTGVLEESIELKDNSVIVAEDLSPADTAQLDMKKVAGFVVEKGSKNSHVAIIARSLELPCVFGINEVCSIFQDDSQIIVDGFEGTVIPQPDEATVEKYQKLKDEYGKRREKLKEVLTLPSETKDHHSVKLALNASTVLEITEDNVSHTDGIGLFRTEFFFMKEPELPDTKRQYENYKQAALAMKGKECIFRLLDIGGDKPLHYVTFPKEVNPFLGWRAIRYCFDNISILNSQLEALVRASAFGKVSILVPMVSNYKEIIFIKNRVKKIMAQLDKENISYDPDLKIGIMIEIPSAVALAPELARVVDFFSIGTNDLVQYTLAVDRGNPKVDSLYEEFHPAVLRFVRQTVVAAHEAGIWAGMCGELAGNWKATPLLIGLGLDELSMNAASIPRVKQILRSVSYSDCTELANEVLRIPSVIDIKNRIEDFFVKHSLHDM